MMLPSLWKRLVTRGDETFVAVLYMKIEDNNKLFIVLYFTT